MESILFFAHILAYTFAGDQYSAAGNTPNKIGVESRVVLQLGPQSPDKALCNSNADAARKQLAARLKLPDYRLLKYECFPATLATR